MIISYKNEHGKRTFKSATTHLKEKGNKKRAEQMLIDLRREFTAKLQIRDNSKGIYFDIYMLSWLEHIKPNVAPTTFSAYSYIIKSSISPYFKTENMLLSELTPKDISMYYDNLFDKGLSSTTVLRHHANIRKALQKAVVDGLIPFNPADRIERPKPQKYMASFYTKDESKKLLKVVQNSDLKIPITLTLFYGLRRSEILGLKWEQIDFSNHTLCIRNSLNEARINGITTLIDSTKLKRKSSYRTLPLTSEMETLLRSDQNDSEYVCCNAGGNVISPSLLSKKFKALLSKNGLRSIRFHDLRHTCAALLIASGVPLIEISHWLGHSTIAITSDLYGHLEFSSKQQCASVIQDTLYT